MTQIMTHYKAIVMRKWPYGVDTIMINSIDSLQLVLMLPLLVIYTDITDADKAP